MTRLKQIIRERGLTQNWLARQLGYHPPQLSKIIAGDLALSVDRIETLAALLKIDVTEMVRALAATRKRKSPDGSQTGIEEQGGAESARGEGAQVS